jgi:mono/diheme cytochrome c family protein
MIDKLFDFSAVRRLLLAAFFCSFLTAACGSVAEPLPPPTLTAVELQGKQVFSVECARCHSAADETVIVGPSLVGIADRASERVQNLSAKDYLLKSILAPDSFMVEGYESLMPADLGKKLTGEEVDAVVAYLLTLHTPVSNN